MRNIISKPGIGAVSLAAAFLFLNTLSVIARPIAKRKAKRRLRDDDYWMFITLAAFYAWGSMMIYVIVRPGRPPPERSQLDEREVMYALRVLYLFTITSVKLSILAFYRGIFDCLRWFEISTIALMALCVLWFASGLSASALIYFLPLCKEFQWSTPGQNGVCTKASQFIIVHRFLNPAVDVAILILPMIVVPKLHLPRRQKLEAAAVFLVGGLIIVVSFSGIAYTQFMWCPKPGLSLEYGMLWDETELGMAIICGNLPTYRPLLPKKGSFQRTLEKWRSIASIWSQKPATESGQDTRIQSPDSPRTDSIQSATFESEGKASPV